MNGRPRTFLRSIALAAAVTAVCAPAVAGHEPIEWTRRYSTDNKVLSWKFAGSYPSWDTTDARDTLEVDWSNSTTNNSRVPSFAYSSSGAGRVFYSASMTSPCSGGTVWLACAKGGGTTGWEIHIRNLSSAPYGSWDWYDRTNSCSSGDVCFRLQRSLIHEPIHLTFGVSHSTQSQSDTVFTAGQPSYSNAGGSTTQLRRCDQAATQLAYDLEDMGGPYGDCFDDIANGTSTGLVTDLTLGSTSFSACQGTAVTVSGRLQVLEYSSYEELGGNPLEGRTVRFDLDGNSNVTSTTAVGGAAPASNWSKTFTSATYGSRTYTAHFDRSSGSGLASSPDRSFTIAWLPANLC
jgi:hypothetical protein